MSQRRRVTLKEHRELEAELHGAHMLLGVILKGVGGQLILSREELQELGETNPQIEAYDIVGTDAFILRLVNDGSDDREG